MRSFESKGRVSSVSCVGMLQSCGLIQMSEQSANVCRGGPRCFKPNKKRKSPEEGVARKQSLSQVITNFANIVD